MKIKMLIMDVDGTMTDGRLYFTAQGDAMKAFHAHDGYGILYKLPQAGILPVILTARNSPILEARARDLHITELHQGVRDKLRKLREIAGKQGISLENAAYIGDDVIDLPCMEACGLSACPADAMEEILGKVDYVCKKQGGRGAVREFIDYILAKNEE